MGFRVKFGVFVALVCSFANAAKLPSTFGRCSAKDPNFNDCLRKNIEDAIHQLKAGSPELGLNVMDPLDIPSLVIGEGKGPVHVVQDFKNIKLYGLTGSKVLSAEIDIDNRILKAKSITPELHLVGDYSINGKVMLLPIFGEGRCNISLYNTNINHTIYGSPVEKKGKTYWTFANYTVTLRPEKMTYDFENLFNGDKRLADNILQVLNDNWNEVFTDVRDGYEKSFGIIFHGLAERAFSRVAVSDIFLDV